MKKLLLILTIFCSLMASAQTMDYETKVIDGKTYYLYPVQKGEGLYRISKNFGVSQEEVVRLNPILKTEGVKLDQILLIPVREVIDSTLYVVHKIEPKQTLYSISKQYKVTIAQIEELNPVTSQTMRIGERLLITKKAVSLPTQKVEDKKEIVQVTEPQITEETKPAPVQDQQRAKEIDNLLAQSFTLNNAEDTLVNENLVDTTVFEGKPIEIAVLLPFMTDAPKRDANTERFSEFYEGLLLAINDLQASGRRFIIRTYDTDKTEARMQTILMDSALTTVDAIVGPAYPQQVPIVTQFAKEHHIPILIPFTSKVNDLADNEWIMQFNPDETTMALRLAEQIEHYRGRVNCVFFTDDKLEQTTSNKVIKDYITTHSINNREVSFYNLLEGDYSAFFSNSQVNLVVLPSDKYNDISSCIPVLKNASNDYPILLLSEYSWQKENIQLDQLYAYLFDAKNNSMSELMSYNANRQQFFQAQIKNDHPRYDLLGYDLTSWLTYVLEQEGDNLTEKILAVGKYTGIQSDLDFNQIDNNGGWLNIAIKINDDKE